MKLEHPHRSSLWAYSLRCVYCPVLIPRPTQPPLVCRPIQGALQQPLELMQNAGLRVDFLSPEVMPAGKQFFDHEYEENYVQLYHNHTRIVHNNWIKGRKDKTERFRGYNLWFVENMQFPSCGKYRATLDRLKNMVIFNNDIRMEIWATGAFVLSAIIVVWYFSAYLHVFGRRGPNV